MSKIKPYEAYGYTRKPVFNNEIKEKIADLLGIDREELGSLILDGKITPVISLNDNLEMFEYDYSNTARADYFEVNWSAITTTYAAGTWTKVTSFTINDDSGLFKYGRGFVVDFCVDTLDLNDHCFALYKNGSLVTAFYTGLVNPRAWSNWAFDLQSGVPEDIEGFSHDGSENMSFDLYVYRGGAGNITTYGVRLIPYWGNSGQGGTDQIAEFSEDFNNFQLFGFTLADSLTVADANNTTLTLVTYGGVTIMTFTGHETSFAFDTSTELQACFPISYPSLYMNANAKANRSCCYLSVISVSGSKIG